MGYINDGFGWRIHPITGVRKWHNGVDYTTSAGVPITTNIPMTVVSTKSTADGYGNIVTLRDESGNTYKYAHLAKMTVKKGQVIPPGTLIGTVGSTGDSTGAHLHFEAADAAGVSKDPNKINPATGKLWSDVSGFKPGQTLNESIADSDSDKTKFSRPRTDPNAEKNQSEAAIRKAEADAKKREEERIRQILNQNSSQQPRQQPRPTGDNVGVSQNKRLGLHDGRKK